jgi:hypothetical protein
MQSNVKASQSELATLERLSESTQWEACEYTQLSESLEISLSLLVDKYNDFRTPNTRTIR